IHPTFATDGAGSRRERRVVLAMADPATIGAAIEIRLSQPQQLFNSLDPSPFHERDLDEDAEQYIVDSPPASPLPHPPPLAVSPRARRAPGGAPELATGRPRCVAHRAE